MLLSSCKYNNEIINYEDEKVADSGYQDEPPVQNKKDHYGNYLQMSAMPKKWRVCLPSRASCPTITRKAR